MASHPRKEAGMGKNCVYDLASGSLQIHLMTAISAIFNLASTVRLFNSSKITINTPFCGTKIIIVFTFRAFFAKILQ